MLSSRIQMCVDSARGSTKSLQGSQRYARIVRRNSPNRKLSHFLSSTERGYFIIVGGPGIGKTGFLLSTYSGSEICYFFQERTPHARLLNFLNYLSAELHTRISKQENALLDWISDPFEAHERVNLLLNELGQFLSQERPLIILVDALDEADLTGDENAMLLKFDLPPHAYVVGTTRSVPRIMDQFIWFPDVRTFRWEAGDEYTIAEVNEYINTRLPKNTTNSVKLIIEQYSHGNILVASRLLDTLRDEGLSLIERGSRTLTLDELFRCEWEYRILQHAEDRDLCEDIATLFAAARAPLSTAIITAGIRHLREKEVKGRHVERVLGQMRTHFESFKGEGHIYLHPFHPSFARWLEEFYRNDLCEAHRGLATAFIGVLEDSKNPDFECATQCVGWHLRQWMMKAPESSQRAQIQASMRDLIGRTDVRSSVEYQWGSDVYLERFLWEGVKFAEEAGSLSDIVHFGSRYLEYRQRAKIRLEELEQFLESKKADKAIQVARTLPSGHERLGCLALVGCWAIDNDRRDVLTDVFKYISEEPLKSFDFFAPVIWSLARRLVSVGDKKLLEHFMSLILEEDYKDSAKKYLPKVLNEYCHSVQNLDLLQPFLANLVRCGETSLEDYVGTVGEIALQSGMPGDRVASFLVNFLNSLQNRSDRLDIAEVVARLFAKHGIFESMQEAIGIILKELGHSNFTSFLDGIIIATDILNASCEEKNITDNCGRFLEVVRGYDRSFEFFKAESLVKIGMVIEKLSPSTDTKALRGEIRSEANLFAHSLFRDYVSVQLVSVTSNHGLYQEAVEELESIEDSLCRTWASALIIGEALIRGDSLPPTIYKFGGKIYEGLSPRSLLVQLAQKILDLSENPMLVPVWMWETCDDSEKTGYPRMIALAIVHIVYFLNNKPENVTEEELMIISKLLEKAVEMIAKIKTKWSYFAYEAMVLLLSQASQIKSPAIRGKVLSKMLDSVKYLSVYYRYDFLEDLVSVLQQTHDEEILDRLVGTLFDLVPQKDHLDLIANFLFKVHAKIGTERLLKVVQGVVDGMVDNKKLGYISFVDEFITVIPKILEPSFAKEVLAQLCAIYLRQSQDLPSWTRRVAFRGIIDSYTQLGFWEETWRFVERLISSDRTDALSHLSFILDCEGRHSEFMSSFIRALQGGIEDNQQWPSERIHSSLAIGFSKNGQFQRALEELREIREPSNISNALIGICGTSQLPLKERAEFEIMIPLLDDVLKRLREPHDLVRGLAAKAQFLENGGFKKEARNIVEEALNIVIKGVKEIENEEACYKLTLASANLCDLLMESGNDDWLQKWFDAAIVAGNRLNTLNMIRSIADTLSPRIAEEKEWFVLRIIETLSSPNIMSVPTMIQVIATKLSAVEDEKLAIRYWEQLLNKFGQMKSLYVEELAVHLCECLAKSAIGTEKVKLLGKLCFATVSCLYLNSSESDGSRVMQRMIHTLVKSSEFKEKDDTLTEMLSVLHLWDDRIWAPLFQAAIAEGWALLGHREKACSLFQNTIDMIDGVEIDFLRNIQKSEALRIMAECGFTEEAQPELQRLRKASGLWGEEVRQNAAMGLLLCNDIDSALLIANETANGEIKAKVAGELFAKCIKELVRLASSENTDRLPSDEGKRDSIRERLSEDMERYFTVVTAVEDTYVRRKELEKMAEEIMQLPMNEAMLWLARLPSFPDNHQMWKTLCASHDYEPKIVREVLEVIPNPSTRNHLIKELAELRGETIQPELSLLLSATGIVDGDCFFSALCNAIENCKDSKVLEEVKQVVDDIEKPRVAERERRPTELREETSADELKGILKKAKKVEKIKRRDPFKQIIGKSRAIRDILTLIEKVKDTNSTVLITGGTGTGKELVAQAIHHNSPRNNAPLVPLNFGAIPETLMESVLFGHKKGAFTGATDDKKGAFERASGGTIFLDEIGDMNKACQVKLLRVLQERTIQPVGGIEEIPINVRVVAATNKDLLKAVREGTFREELLYRLNVFCISMPALRERKEDIPFLVEHFLTHLCKKIGKTKKSLSDEAMKKLLLYDWPGNIRQLENCIEKAILLASGDIVEANNIILEPVEVPRETLYNDDFEKQLLTSKLQESKTVAEAIRKLNMRKSTFYDKVKRYNINPKSFLAPRG